jgi:hypothetical protein
MTIDNTDFIFGSGSKQQSGPLPSAQRTADLH